MPKQIAPSHRGFQMIYIRCEDAKRLKTLTARLQSQTPYKVTKTAVIGQALDALEKRIGES